MYPFHRKMLMESEDCIPTSAPEQKNTVVCMSTNTQRPHIHHANSFFRIYFWSDSCITINILNYIYTKVGTSTFTTYVYVVHTYRYIYIYIYIYIHIHVYTLLYCQSFQTKSITRSESLFFRTSEDTIWPRHLHHIYIYFLQRISRAQLPISTSKF
jgi:hypothetical protein